MHPRSPTDSDSTATALAAASATATTPTKTSTAAETTARFFAALAHGASDRSIPLYPAQQLADPPLHATVRQPKRADHPTAETGRSSSSTTSAAAKRFWAALAHGASDRSIPLHPAQRLADPPLHATVRQPKRDQPAPQPGITSSSAAAKRFWAALAYGASDRHIPLGSPAAAAAGGKSDIPPPEYSEKSV
ncbi:hypothetical protein DFJ73DRAFT_782956 [Zopfochytrium polystomum]|nr:hypothetical protein DFJ73DRAFT_782956 [Zopfochytrium polystomum]